MISQVLYNINNKLYEHTESEPHNIFALSGPECFGQTLNEYLGDPIHAKHTAGRSQQTGITLMSHNTVPTNDSLWHKKRLIAKCQQLGHCVSFPNSPHYSQIKSVYRSPKTEYPGEADTLVN